MTGARSALIVATYQYVDPRLRMLKAPQRDAEALAEVLGDPAIGGFEVKTVVNQPSHVISLELAEFFSHRHSDDLLLVHFSCHGVKDDSGELFLAASDTRMDLLEATAVASAFVNKSMTRSRSGCVVLLLDCCYAGAFARGMTRAGSDVDVTDRFGGRGRAVITASTALQLAFEGDELTPSDPEAPGPFAFADEERLRTILSDAGFGNIDLQRFDTAIFLGTTPRSAAEGVVQMGPVSRLVREVGVERLPIIVDAIEQTLTPLAAPNGHVSLNGSTWIVSATNPA